MSAHRFKSGIKPCRSTRLHLLLKTKQLPVVGSKPNMSHIAAQSNCPRSFSRRQKKVGFLPVEAVEGVETVSPLPRRASWLGCLDAACAAFFCRAPRTEDSLHAGITTCSSVFQVHLFCFAHPDVHLFSSSRSCTVLRLTAHSALAAARNQQSEVRTGLCLLRHWYSPIYVTQFLKQSPSDHLRFEEQTCEGVASLNQVINPLTLR